MGLISGSTWWHGRRIDRRAFWDGVILLSCFHFALYIPRSQTFSDSHVSSSSSSYFFWKFMSYLFDGLRTCILECQTIIAYLRYKFPECFSNTFVCVCLRPTYCGSMTWFYEHTFSPVSRQEHKVSFAAHIYVSFLLFFRSFVKTRS